MKLIAADVIRGKIEASINWVNINLEEDRFSEGCKASLKDLLSTLEYYTPTVDAVPVVHGHWINKMKINNCYPVVECSECGICSCDSINNHKFMYNYCPHCGAKLDGEVEEDEKAQES